MCVLITEGGVCVWGGVVCVCARTHVAFCLQGKSSAYPHLIAALLGKEKNTLLILYVTPAPTHTAPRKGLQVPQRSELP